MLLMKLVWIEGLGVDPDDRAEGAEAADEKEDRDEQQGGVLDRGAGDREGEGGEPDADDQRPEGAADQIADVHLPVMDRGGEHVVDEAVVPALEDRRGVVRVGGLGHRHRDQAGDDELLVLVALDHADPAAEREAEDDDEEQRADHRRERGLGPEAQDAVALTPREPEESLPGVGCDGGRHAGGRHEARPPARSRASRSIEPAPSSTWLGLSSVTVRPASVGRPEQDREHRCRLLVGDPLIAARVLGERGVGEVDHVDVEVDEHAVDSGGRDSSAVAAPPRLGRPGPGRPGSPRARAVSIASLVGPRLLGAPGEEDDLFGGQQRRP